tara:strand:- start:5742 stop:6326 length:585 start_codon:yes stop_codon:yes gene_type:complete
MSSGAFSSTPPPTPAPTPAPAPQRKKLLNKKQLALMLGSLKDTIQGEDSNTLQRLAFLDDRENKQAKKELFDRTRQRLQQGVEDGSVQQSSLDLFDAFGPENTAEFLKLELQQQSAIPKLSQLEVQAFLDFREAAALNPDLTPEQFFKNPAELDLYENIFRKPDAVQDLINSIILSGTQGLGGQGSDVTNIDDL